MGCTGFLEPRPNEPLWHVRWKRQGWAEQVRFFQEDEAVELVKTLTSDPSVTLVQLIPTGDKADG